MDNSQLAALMLEWEAAQRKADELAAQIKLAVLEIGKTQVVGNVRATFAAGRRTFDYRAAVDAAEAEVARLRAALADIAAMTDADDPESYRCDDREGCLDAVYAKATRGQDAP